MRYGHYLMMLYVSIALQAVGILGVAVAMAAEIVPTVLGMRAGFSPLMGEVSLSFLGAFILGLMTKIAANQILNLVLLTKKLSIDIPNSPEGNPVAASGHWIADNDQLSVGSQVLACTRGQWHRAEVIRVLSRKRVMLHFPGWDPFWDEAKRTRDCQWPFDPSPKMIDGAFREKAK